jgi:hypothetical protein
MGDCRGAEGLPTRLAPEERVRCASRHAPRCGRRGRRATASECVRGSSARDGARTRRSIAVDLPQRADGCRTRRLDALILRQRVTRFERTRQTRVRWQWTDPASTPALSSMGDFSRTGRRISAATTSRFSSSPRTTVAGLRVDFTRSRNSPDVATHGESILRRRDGFRVSGSGRSDALARLPRWRHRWR